MTRITKASAVDGTSEEDISKAEESLKSVGVQVRKSAGEFRDMTDIMRDLGAVWNDLNDVQQSNISYEIAGTRQTNIIKTLLLERLRNSCRKSRRFCWYNNGKPRKVC